MDIIQKGFIKADIQCVDVDPTDMTISKDEILLSDSPLIAIKYILKGFKNHIVWFQGVSPEESFMSHKSRLRSKVISSIEKVVLKKAKMVFLVSERMKSHYEKKYHIDLSDKACVMPCFNETEIVKDAFNDLKYDHNNFLYVGSLLPWQCFEETAALYAEIEKKSKYSTKFCVFTHQKDEATQVLLRHDVKHYEVDCVSKEDLSDRIKDMKYGFVLRKESVVNRVATPTKFSNYLANGIIPIYSSALDSFTAFDRDNKLGIICDLDDSKQGIESILAHMELKILAKDICAKCQNAFDSYYNAELYCDKIADFARAYLVGDRR
jgi:hypothetical protein